MGSFLLTFHMLLLKGMLKAYAFWNISVICKNGKHMLFFIYLFFACRKLENSLWFKTLLWDYRQPQTQQIHPWEVIRGSLDKGTSWFCQRSCPRFWWRVLTMQMWAREGSRHGSASRTNRAGCSPARASLSSRGQVSGEKWANGESSQWRLHLEVIRFWRSKAQALLGLRCFRVDDLSLILSHF